jgi:pyruvate dehydrogenase E1 component beta subunit
MKEAKYVLQRGALRMALDRLLAEDNSILLLGEDIGAYGGAFQVSSGLQKKFGESRVVDAPISESGLMGLSIGLALGGFKPILEVMFMDFAAQIVDQLLNQAVKLEGMYNGQLKVPLIIRTPAGGYREYGPTHSQSLEGLFASIPELEIIYPYSAQDYYSQLLWYGRNLKSPVLFIENKELYLKKGPVEEEILYKSSTHKFVFGTGRDNLIISYGYATDIAISALEKSGKNGTVWCILNLKPEIMDDLEDVLTKCGNVLVAGESPTFASIQEHIAAKIYYEYFRLLRQPIKILGSKGLFIPARRDMEAATLLSANDIAEQLI